MRVLILLLFVALVGCTSGPGKTCDATAVEANPTGGAQAAAAAATGGQRANNAPKADDLVSPYTTVGRGGGATTASKADTREVASGGAQNLGLLIPATANATNSGGVSPVLAQYGAEIASLQRSRDMAQTVEERMAVSAQIATMMVEMGKASASGRANVTNNYSIGGANTLIGVSASKTGKQNGLDPEATAALAKAASEIATSESAGPVLPPAPPVPTGGGQ
jgi:hypothetical protein